MGQLVNVLLAIDKAHTIPQRALDYIPSFGGLNQVLIVPTIPLPLFRVSVASIATSLPDVK